MRIKYIAPSPRAGEVTHIDNATGRTLCAAGFAVEEKYRDFRERLAAEATSQTVGVVQNVNVVGEEWGIDTSLTRFRQVVIVFKRGSEEIIYDGPTKDTPPSIVKQFNEAVGTTLTAEQVEAFRVQQCKEQQQRAQNTEAEKKGMARFLRT
jgi:hypothetical protein